MLVTSNCLLHTRAIVRIITLVSMMVVSPINHDQSKIVSVGPNGKLAYKAEKNGDQILDFSNCGYRGGGVKIPAASVKVMLAPSGTDDRIAIQAAVDRVAKMPKDKDGIRGAVRLAKGVFVVSDSIEIHASGIVIQGSGDSDTGTRIIASGTKQYPVFNVAGISAPKAVGMAIKITDSYVPVGARSFRVADASGVTVGDKIFVRRQGNAAWIHTIGMDQIKVRASEPDQTKQWKPFSLDFDRIVTDVKGNEISVDAPLACSIDTRWGGGEIRKYTDDGRIEQIGIEDLRADSRFDKSKISEEGGTKFFSDEDHATYLASFESVKNGWIRHVTATHFYEGVVECGKSSKWITIEDSKALDMVSELTGGRRYPFNFSGQLLLVQRCTSRNARHAFVVGGSRTCGPNVFLHCDATENHNSSEPHQRWSVGGLYDNVDAKIAIQDRQWMGSGHGWAGANYVVWNCRGSLICQQPPTSQNYAVGFVGNKEPGAFVRPDGWWESLGKAVTPSSLYLKQLEDRLGPSALKNIGY